MDESLQGVKNKAVDYLSRRDHSEYELRTKLLKKGYDSNLIDLALQAMHEANYLDDERYARMIVRSGFERGHGPQKIRFKLQQQRVAKELVSAVFEIFEGDWFELSRGLKLRKFGVLEMGADKSVYYKERSRQMRFLAGRGFGMEHIEYALEVAHDDE